jgi:hypothetical protein
MYSAAVWRDIESILCHHGGTSGLGRLGKIQEKPPLIAAEFDGSFESVPI